jgi:hypothetical protein
MSVALCLITLRTGYISVTTLNIYVVERQQSTLQISVLFLPEKWWDRTSKVISASFHNVPSSPFNITLPFGVKLNY